MFKSINLVKISSTALLGILATGTLISQSAMAAPVKIDSLDTTRVPATSRTGNVCDQNGANCAIKNYGTGTNIKLNGFRAGGQDYSILKLVDEVRFQRVNNSQVQGQKHIYFLEKGSNNSIGSSMISTMEDAVRSNFINSGTDNVFANSGGVNLNNIERVDFLINSGLIVKPEYTNDAGFLLLERGGNDPFKIAPITAIDANGNPSSFGNLISVPVSTWGSSNLNILTNVFQNQSNWNAPRLTGDIGSQNIKGVFISIASLGIASNQTVYGYAIFPGDITSSSDLVGLSNFPKTTSADSGQGGLDLISSGGLFIPENVPESAVFKPASAVNDIIATNEDNSVNGNVLTNDIGDSLVVTSTGQKTLTSGAKVNINSNGTYTYNPNGQFEALETGVTRTDTFSYTMRDGSGNVGSATVTITINGAADTPDAVEDSFTTDEDTSTTGNVKTNDTDPNGDNLTVTMVNGQTANVGNQVRLASGALLTLNSDGTFTYNPNSRFESLNDGQTATDTFSYTINDGHGNTDSADVTMTIDGVTDPVVD
ncbi:Ig-like domain-containing protein [Pleurocapsa sp. CCALA 161]|uniref:Ig-like domain-containing protein n=1 Tax=Pleurocapsa sp. CCALA 161 TaxID=2107688 RepID=UPI0011B29688|nr:Ig-like domain-containing protein [Pleurocapsa sp. CCALA 161]